MKRFLIVLLLSLTIFGFSIEKKECRPACDCLKKFAYSKSICHKKHHTELSYLHMNFFEDGLEYAQVVSEDEKVFRNEQKFNPGVRLTIGFPLSILSPIERYLDLTWTYIKMKRASTTGDRGTIYALFLPPFFLASTKASATLSGNFNTVDLTISKPYHVSKFYISKPSIGIRAAIIDQKYRITYHIAQLQSNIRAKNDYYGIGIKAGYLADFIINSNYSFYAKANFALLYGRVDLSQKTPGDINSLLQYTIKEKTRTVQPNTEIAFGVSFDRNLTNHIDKLSIKVGYEFLQFWDQLQLKRLMSQDPTAVKTVSRNNLKFNGLVFSILIDF
ncbi:MAG: hypothetical protein K1060chlam1_00585 [Candidatus Anoxychlamydiales bacterium]|nr:hypothetical protein [Candidatus Anoxychlamydiales bacterium]